MRLLLEEAISQEPMKVTKVKASTGDEYDHHDLVHSPRDYCAITIIRAGDSMLDDIYSLMPGISVGKILIQRDEATEDKRPVYYYAKLPDNISEKERIFILDPMLGTGGTICCALK